MRLNELQAKDVISVKTGKNLGRIMDIELNIEGFITGIVIEERGLFKLFFRGNNKLNIKVKDIVKIGDDVILVNVW